MTTKSKTIKAVHCPLCGSFLNRPFVALSRRDNKTTICSECGHREAVEDIVATLRAESGARGAVSASLLSKQDKACEALGNKIADFLGIG